MQLAPVNVSLGARSHPPPNSSTAHRSRKHATDSCLVPGAPLIPSRHCPARRIRGTLTVQLPYTYIHGIGRIVFGSGAWSLRWSFNLSLSTHKQTGTLHMQRGFSGPPWIHCAPKPSTYPPQDPSHVTYCTVAPNKNNVITFRDPEQRRTRTPARTSRNFLLPDANRTPALSLAPPPPRCCCCCCCCCCLFPPPPPPRPPPPPPHPQALMALALPGVWKTSQPRVGCRRRAGVLEDTEDHAGEYPPLRTSGWPGVVTGCSNS